MDRRAFIGAVATTAVAGCLDMFGQRQLECDEDCDIGMSADAYRPETYEVTVGEEVTWKNTSTKGHTVTAFDHGVPDGAAFFASGGYDDQSEAEDAWFDEFGGRLDTGDTFSHTFEVPGTYEYYCIPHLAADMVGTVVVSE